VKNDYLETYLNDHLAGSVGALDLIERMIKTYGNQPIAQFCRQMRDEIHADQDELRKMMAGLGIKESSLRKAGALVAEKLSRTKLQLKGEETGDLGVLQALEGLVLGIKGKEALWRALGAVQASWPPLQRFDFPRLQKRATEQGASVDEKRMQTASQVLRPRADE
jgi:hypothetical protein